MNKLSFFSIVELMECLIFNDFVTDFEEKRCLNKPLSFALSLSLYSCTASTFSRQFYFWLSRSEDEFRLVETVLLFFGSKFACSEPEDIFCSPLKTIYSSIGMFSSILGGF